MESGRNETINETFDMSLAGEIILHEEQLKIEGTNKSGKKYIWDPIGYFSNILKKIKEARKDGVYIHIHTHALNDGETCELGKMVTGKPGKFTKYYEDYATKFATDLMG